MQDDADTLLAGRDSAIAEYLSAAAVTNAAAVEFTRLQSTSSLASSRTRLGRGVSYLSGSVTVGAQSVGCAAVSAGTAVGYAATSAGSAVGSAAGYLTGGLRGIAGFGRSTRGGAAPNKD